MIAQKIRLIRIAKGISQDYMAIRLNFTQSNYSKLENNKIPITFERLQEIASLLGCSTSEVISYGDNESLVKRVLTLEENILKIQNTLENQQNLISNLLNK